MASRNSPGQRVRGRLGGWLTDHGPMREDLVTCYVRVEDPLPAGAEAIDPTLLTSSPLKSGGYRVPLYTSDLAWYVRHVELRDDRAALFAPYLPAGVYRYEYTV